MELKPGYKKTEAGVIPAEWNTWSVAQVSRNLLDYRGRTPRKLGMDWGGGEIPALSAGNVKMGYIDFEQECYLGSDALYNRWMTNGDVRKNDIIITMEAPLGNVALIPDDQRYILSQRTVLLQLHPERAFGPYLFQAMLSQGFQRLLTENATGSTAQGIQRKRFEKLVVVCPPLPEQRAIAAALSDVDALLTKLDQFIAKKRDLKHATMQQLLTGQTRLPGFSREWVKRPLHSLGQTYGGLTGKTKLDFGHGRARYIPFMNVMTDTVIDINWLEHVDVAPDESQNQTRAGDLLFNGSSETPEEVGYCALLLEDVPDLYLNSFCFGFRFDVDAQVDGLYFAYWFRSASGRKAMMVLAQGATRYNIAKTAFLKLEVPQPAKDEQSAISNVLSDMDAEIAALESRRDKTRTLKQGMMQELLTGRIRLV